MSPKIGRNDACPCGSGKKYKKCCQSALENRVPSDPADFQWYQLRQLEGAVVDRHLAPYVTEHLPKTLMNLALTDVLPEDVPEFFQPAPFFEQFFMPWFLFNWQAFEDVEVDSFDPTQTVAQNYLQLYSDQLSEQERGFIEAMNDTYYSFYSVQEVILNQQLVVKDILLGTTHTIKERLGTHQLKRGDVLLSRLLQMKGQAIFIGMMPFILASDEHVGLIDFKDWLLEESEQPELTGQVLREEFEVEIIDYFFECLETKHGSGLPTLYNTDNEPIQFSKSYFKLRLSPEETLTRLLPLTLSKNKDEFLEDATRTRSDEIKQLEFPWLKKGNKRHKGWENTVMGHVCVEPKRLILETNSEQRTEKGKKLLSKYLGDAIVFQQTLIESPEQKMRNLEPSKKKGNQERDDLNALPEVQDYLQTMMKAHWERWFDEPIPALKNQTPREAARTAEGRERLEALLLSYERHDAEKSDNLCKADMAYLRAELALDEHL